MMINTEVFFTPDILIEMHVLNNAMMIWMDEVFHWIFKSNPTKAFCAGYEKHKWEIETYFWRRKRQSGQVKCTAAMVYHISMGPKVTVMEIIYLDPL